MEVHCFVLSVLKPFDLLDTGKLSLKRSFPRETDYLARDAGDAVGKSFCQRAFFYARAHDERSLKKKKKNEKKTETFSGHKELTGQTNELDKS